MLRGNSKSVYADYEKTKRDVYWLKSFIDRNIEEKVLTHIDAVPDNFLFVKDEYGKEQRFIVILQWVVFCGVIGVNIKKNWEIVLWSMQPISISMQKSILILHC